jgi:hypothetical protein
VQQNEASKKENSASQFTLFALSNCHWYKAYHHHHHHKFAIAPTTNRMQALCKTINKIRYHQTLKAKCINKFVSNSVLE